MAISREEFNRINENVSREVLIEALWIYECILDAIEEHSPEAQELLFSKVPEGTVKAAGTSGMSTEVLQDLVKYTLEKS